MTQLYFYNDGMTHGYKKINVRVMSATGLADISVPCDLRDKSET